MFPHCFSCIHRMLNELRNRHFTEQKRQAEQEYQDICRQRDQLRDQYLKLKSEIDRMNVSPARLSFELHHGADMFPG